MVKQPMLTVYVAAMDDQVSYTYMRMDSQLLLKETRE